MDRKDSYTEIFLKAANQDCSQESIEKYKSVLWQSLRSKEVGGLRLTDQGLEFIKNESDIKIYEIEIPKEIKLTAQIVIWLDRYIDTPFHLTAKTISVISERTAFELYLFSGDVKKFGTARSLAKRINQD